MTYFSVISKGTQVSTKKAILIESGVQCNIANLPPLSLLSNANVEDLDPEQRMKPAILEFPEEEPFQDVEVDDEDYNPSLDPEEDEDETDEIKPER